MYIVDMGVPLHIDSCLSVFLMHQRSVCPTLYNSYDVTFRLVFACSFCYFNASSMITESFETEPFCCLSVKFFFEVIFCYVTVSIMLLLLCLLNVFFCVMLNTAN